MDQGWARVAVRLFIERVSAISHGEAGGREKDARIPTRLPHSAPAMRAGPHGKQSTAIVHTPGVVLELFSHGERHPLLPVQTSPRLVYLFLHFLKRAGRGGGHTHTCGHEAGCRRCTRKWIPATRLRGTWNSFSIDKEAEGHASAACSPTAPSQDPAAPSESRVSPP